MGIENIDTLKEKIKQNANDVIEYLTRQAEDEAKEIKTKSTKQAQITKLIKDTIVELLTESGAEALTQEQKLWFFSKLDKHKQSFLDTISKLSSDKLQSALKKLPIKIVAELFSKGKTRPAQDGFLHNTSRGKKGFKALSYTIQYAILDAVDSNTKNNLFKSLPVERQAILLSHALTVQIAPNTVTSTVSATSGNATVAVNVEEKKDEKDAKDAKDAKVSTESKAEEKKDEKEAKGNSVTPAADSKRSTGVTATSSGTAASSTTQAATSTSASASVLSDQARTLSLLPGSESIQQSFRRTKRRAADNVTSEPPVNLGYTILFNTLEKPAAKANILLNSKLSTNAKNILIKNVNVADLFDLLSVFKKSSLTNWLGDRKLKSFFNSLNAEGKAELVSKLIQGGADKYVKMARILLANIESKSSLVAVIDRLVTDKQLDIAAETLLRYSPAQIVYVFNHMRANNAGTLYKHLPITSTKGVNRGYAMILSAVSNVIAPATNALTSNIHTGFVETDANFNRKLNILQNITGDETKAAIGSTLDSDELITYLTNRNLPDNIAIDLAMAKMTDPKDGADILAKIYARDTRLGARLLGEGLAIKLFHRLEPTLRYQTLCALFKLAGTVKTNTGKEITFQDPTKGGFLLKLANALLRSLTPNEQADLLVMNYRVAAEQKPQSGQETKLTLSPIPRFKYSKAEDMLFRMVNAHQPDTGADVRLLNAINIEDGHDDDYVKLKVNLLVRTHGLLSEKSKNELAALFHATSFETCSLNTLVGKNEIFRNLMLDHPEMAAAILERSGITGNGKKLLKYFLQQENLDDNNTKLALVKVLQFLTPTAQLKYLEVIDSIEQGVKLPEYTRPEPTPSRFPITYASLFGQKELPKKKPEAKVAASANSNDPTQPLLQSAGKEHKR